MNVHEVNRITAVRVVADHTVELQFSDGYEGRLCLLPAIWGPVFEPLQDATFFREVRVEDDTIRWPNDADFCPDVLRFWCESGGVQSQEETDSHLIKQTSNRAAS